MANLKWYINRLKMMNHKEIIHRVECRKYDNKIQNGYRLKENNYTINFIKLPKINESYEYEDEILLSNCESILHNNIEIFNAKVDLNNKDKFLQDPFSKELWERKIYTKVSFRKSNLPGDPKIIWEINKQQYLLDLGLAYKVTGKDIYAKKIIDEIDEWIKQNPLYMGINWTSGLEISLRCLSWMFSLSLIKEYIITRQIDINRILHYLRAKTELIFNKLSLFSSANNHLIGELTLLLYSSYFMDCEETLKWRNTSLSMLKQQINNQFYNDGVNKEQSVNYQIHTMELYFLCQYILKLNSESFEKEVLDILKKACFYLSKLSEKDGTSFNIGDEDGGHILKLQNHPNSILSILQFGAIVLNDVNIYNGKLKKRDYKLLLLFGEEYTKWINGLDKIEESDVDTYLFKDGGMYIKNGEMNNISYKAMFDFGDIGMAPLNAHAHCDILSFNLNISGNPLLIDCGTYKYHQDSGFRDFFRGVKAHNTISINDMDQVEFLGPFICSKSPKITLINEGENYISCSSDMYKRFKCVVERKLNFDENYIIIKDKIINKSTSMINIKRYFNFDERVFCEIENNNCVCIVDDIKVTFIFDKSSSIILNKGNEKEKIGWQSKKFYEKKPCFTLEIKNGVAQNSISEMSCKINIEKIK